MTKARWIDVDHARLRRAALLAVLALVLAIAATVADAVLGNRIGSQGIAWALGLTVGLMLVRGALARLGLSGVAPGATPVP